MSNTLATAPEALSAFGASPRAAAYSPLVSSLVEISGYEGFQIIGRGGFAIVYKARQISVGREVAIKVLSDPAPDADLVRRFERESKAVGALSWHPHIAAVVDAGTTSDGRAFIVFELLTGGSLDDRLDSGPLRWNDAVSAMIQVADAVEAAHRETMLHRDIKPANIMLNRLGDAKLADFGIASMQDGNKTETGLLATTVAHAAPELFDGAPASELTDIYALGSTLHTLVTGTPPFVPTEGERIATIIKAISTEAPPTPDPAFVPAAVANVIATALAKQPRYRPQSALAFGKALQQVQREAGVSVTSMPVGDSEPAPADPTIALGPPPAEASLPAPGWPAAAPTPPSVPPSGAASATTNLAPPINPASHTPAPSTPAPRPAAPSTPAPRPAQTAPPYPLAAHPAHADIAGRSPNGPSQHPPAGAPTHDGSQRKPFGRTIGVLSMLLVMLVPAIGGAYWWQTSRSPDAIAVTAGGAAITSVDATDETALQGFPPEAAVDGRLETSWGISSKPDVDRMIIGTTYTIKLDQPMRVTAVGVSNGPANQLGRISGLTWGLSVDDLRQRSSQTVMQQIPAASGDHLVPFGQVTDQIALVITGTHEPDNASAGIAELLLNAEKP